jgi:aryl-alcohol dehydrogenase-like predicted oxidoreductase
LHARSIEPKTAEQILDTARESGVKHLDTAPSYGGTEALLGSIGIDDFEVTTKVPSIPLATQNSTKWIEQRVETSLKNLKKETLECLLLHDPEQLATSRGPEIHAALLMLKNRGIARTVGISIYETATLTEIHAKGWLQSYDVVQTPLNVFDNRIVESGWAAKLLQLGIKLQARSLFLQGVLLLDDVDIAPNLRVLRPYLDQWREFVRLTKENAYSVALGAVLAREEISDFVVGMDSVLELKEFLRYLSARPTLAKPNFDFPAWIMDPRCWPERL